MRSKQVVRTMSLAFAVSLSGATNAYAQASPAVAEQPKPGEPELPLPSSAAPPQAAPSPSQAPPLSPSATDPSKATQAARQAKEAELTPIVPSPRDVTRPAFQLYAETDLPVLGIGVVLTSAHLIRTQGAYCAPQCNPADLNSLDRTTAGYWSPAWTNASDIAISAMMGGTAIALAVDEGPLPALNDAVVITEAGLSATAFSSILTLAAGRPRPFVYGDKAPLSTRNSANGALSFLSNHTAVSFAIATSLYMTERRLHPNQDSPYLFWGVGLAAASFVGTARVMAGRHFITDAVGGAIVGTSVGVLVPSLHGSPVRVVPSVTKKEGSLSILGMF